MDRWEVVSDRFTPRPARAAVFDFDGTLSLLREGWARVMAELGRDLLREQSLLTEPEPPLLHHLEDQMLRLSGQPSIYQMRKLSEEVRSRGGRTPGDEVLLDRFLNQLFETVNQRKADIASGAVSPSAWCVPGAEAMLQTLQQRGIPLYLASGTDLDFVHDELKLLQLDHYFGPRVYAPAKNTANFHKRDALHVIMTELGIRGEEIIGFGDGYAETVEVRKLGGTVVGLATHVPGTPGRNEMKRSMLIELGADVIVTDYEPVQPLIRWLFGE